MMLSYLSVVIPYLATIGRARLAEHAWPPGLGRMTLPSIRSTIRWGRRAANARVERP